ncbi:hypothetical protein F8388_014049 [Cannabis sativa]|uniref:CCHC-type domain-containing protein n=1 Tax=Cannabis sativa TaxID=3483 RepID=A0A7J6FHB4_CANSA|nr:hypothetical protein G4B88_028363 [Cannabis sativa]KAF4383549.1 hypothetical protein F8388_014049 [Cannabis sativa]
MIDLFVLLVCMATGGGGGNLSETVDDIVPMTSKLGVSSEEDWEENEEAASSFGEHSLVGRLVAKREIKESLFTTIFNRMWKGIGGWEVKVLEEDEEDSIAGITFKTREEVVGILNKQPWIFNGGLLLLEKWPNSAFTRANVMRLGEIAGEVQEIRWINENRMFLNGFVRMKIGFPLKQSIFVGRYIPCGGRKFWIQFKFERLPTLCFACGVWGHEKRECGKEALMETSEDGLQVSKYGQWLKDDDPIPHCFSAFYQNQAETHIPTGIYREKEGEGLTEVDNSTRHFVVAPETGTEDRVEAPMIHNVVTAKSSGIAFIGESSIVGDGKVTNTVPGGNGEKNYHFGTLDQVDRAGKFNINVPNTLGRAGNINVTEPNTLGQFTTNNNPKENKAASDVFDTHQGGSTSDGITEGAESEAKKRKNGGKDGETEEERDRRALLKEKVGKSSLHGDRKKISIKNRARNHGKGRAVVFNANDGGVPVSLGGVDSNEMGQQFVFVSEAFNGTKNVNYWAVDRVGLSGGLLLLWKEELSVRVDSSSPGHLLVRVAGQDFFPWTLTYSGEGVDYGDIGDFYGGFRLKTRKVGAALHGWNKKKKRTLQEKTNKLKKAISELSSR